MPQRIHIQIHKSKQQSNIEVSKASTTPPTILNHNLGLRNYELSNHLGNVTTVISDRKIPRSILGTNINFYMPDIVSATDYYPFGMTMQERSFSAGGAGYRYGFNGKENDAESNTQDYGMRIYDTRFGMFLSVDPLTNKFAMLTPYQFASNTPIQAIHLDGEKGINIVDHQAKITTIVLQIIYVPSESKNTENGSGFTDKEVKQIQANLNNYLQQYQGEFMDNRYTDENGDAYEVQFNFYFTPVANTKEASVVIQEQGTFTSYLVYRPTICGGSATLIANGASNYTWTPGGFNTSSIVVTPSITATYTIHGTNGSCLSSITTTVTVNTAPAFTIEVSNPIPFCPGSCTNFSVTSGYNPVTFDFGDATGTFTNSTHCYATIGIYTVNATGTFSSGCIASTNRVIPISFLPVNTATFDVNGTQHSPGSVVSITSYGNNGNWNFGDGTNALSLSNPTHIYNTGGTYCIKMVTPTNSVGCADSLTKCIDVIQPISINNPNVFTPNADGINDVFKAKAFFSFGYSNERR